MASLGSPGLRSSLSVSRLADLRGGDPPLSGMQSAHLRERDLTAHWERSMLRRTERESWNSIHRALLLRDVPLKRVTRPRSLSVSLSLSLSLLSERASALSKFRYWMNPRRSRVPAPRRSLGRLGIARRLRADPTRAEDAYHVCSKRVWRHILIEGPVRGNTVASGTISTSPRPHARFGFRVAAGSAFLFERKLGFACTSWMEHNGARYQAIAR